MASPQQRPSPLPPGAVRSPAGAANGGSPLGDEAIWKRLRESGFDEETVKRRDKIALIAYITKLESEIYDYQHQMGLLILERKELISKNEQLKASTESAEMSYKRDHAAQLSALAEARKREESLKKAVGIEKECVANIEKALHDMRAVSAETKHAYESKMAEAREMMESAQNKFDEAESKLHAAESLHAEASRCQNTASRNLQDVEAREDELRRRLTSFKSECEAKEKEINLQRQSLYDSQKLLYQEQERVLEGQTLLNQREEYIFGRSKELSHFEKEVEEAKAKLEEESRALKEEKSNLELAMAALATREEAVFRRESLLDRRERELLILQEKIASKEYDQIQRLKDEHQSALERKMRELEAEIEQRCLSLEDEVTSKRTACEVKEADLNHRESLIHERELALESELNSLSEKQADLAKRFKLLEDKEKNLHTTQKTMEMEMLELQKERDQIKQMKVDIEKTEGTLEDKKKEILHVKENFEVTVSERNELLLLETKLKEEIDSFRAQKKELMDEADKLKAEKEKFEMEWEFIDEKREELRKEAERSAEEREAVGKYLKNEHDSIKVEKENLRNQFRKEAASLSREREEFMGKMEREYSDWFNKIQQEREDFARDICIQRKELENCIEKRREEIETYLREKEEAFEQERAIELQSINSQKEKIAKELEHVSSELKRLDSERVEIVMDRERREREWSEIKSSIELLNIQREKLQKQRELLHADREEISKQIENLNKLEDLNIESENRALSVIQTRHLNSSIWKVPVKRSKNMNAIAQHIDDQNEQKITADGGITPKLLPDKTPNSSSPPVSATISWIRKVIFRRSPEELDTSCEANFESKISANFGEVSGGNEIKSQNVYERMRLKGRERTGRKDARSVRSNLEESNDIHEKPTLRENDEMLLNKKPKNGTDKSIDHLKQDAVQDMSGERSRSTDGHVNLLISGRKRLNNLLSQDHADVPLEPSRKHQKKTRQKGSADVEEIISNSMVSTQTPCSDDESGQVSLDRTLGWKEMSAGYMDRDHGNPKVSTSRPPEISQDTSVLHSDVFENGRSNGSYSSHVGNGMLSSSSNPPEKVTMEAEAPPKKITEPTTELLADNGGKVKEQDEDNKSNDDDEDDGRATVEEKL